MSSMNEQAAWHAVLRHDRRFDDRFVYAVSTTKIYCRPSCASRRPARAHVTFFLSPQHAEEAGYRACLRCHPRSMQATRIQAAIAQARRYLDDHAVEPVPLRQLAQQAGMSPSHLQRAFTRVIGLSPKAYHDTLRLGRCAAALGRGETVTAAVYEAGFGSASRLYERASGVLGMTPATFRAGGSGATLRYATVPTTFGVLLIAATNRGIAAVRFGTRAAALAADLKRDYPRAMVRRDPHGMKSERRLIVRCLRGSLDPADLPLDLKGTPFQRKVWAALQQIPHGSTRTYREIAQDMGQPTAMRAVGRACAANPIALAIPCHRVVRADGRPAGYRWGVKRKTRLLEQESRQRASKSTSTGPLPAGNPRV